MYSSRIGCSSTALYHTEIDTVYTRFLDSMTLPFLCTVDNQGVPSGTVHEVLTQHSTLLQADIATSVNTTQLAHCDAETLWIHSQGF